ncbi:hypothetical protein AJ79_00215 [Helicocarpus griseus UAMH5409]|uniref:Heterokaryon incompatibility domain-containing protein n=1 Tax=Helicocarpus griseus UAMH5409 TaxID=1447875 RepID=A0A2B7YD57_9EURO|nr:hypothetical protein AJ79_00215 [Helicocarpus griseus UAMH5409]
MDPFLLFEERLLVPYLCAEYEECNEHNFIDYAKTYGFDVATLILKGDNHSAKDLDDLAAFLQAWLVFGLLRRVLGPSDMSVRLEDLVSGLNSDETESVNCKPGNELSELQHSRVDTAGLVLYFMYWIAKESHVDDPERRDRLWAQHVATLKMTNSVVNDLIAWRSRYYPIQDGGKGDVPVLDSIILSIVLLSEYVLATSRAIFSDHSWSLEWGLDNALLSRLLRAGWCPGEATVLHNKFIHSTSLYIVGGFDRHSLNKDHSRCSKDECVANNIDESVYKTKHVSDDCNCAHVGEANDNHPSASQLLREGSIPVIKVYSSGSRSRGKVTISVQDYTKAPYVAISHVWSDGLGNANANTLPRCQLRRLQGYVNCLYPKSFHPVPFWIDTICVPLERQVRKTAIRRMGQTYKNADSVLVIDSWLNQTGLDGPRAVDLLKVKSCTWTQRLWTLQEALLAQANQLYFQTPEGPLVESELAYGPRDMGIGIMERIIGSEDDNLHEVYPDVAKTMILALSNRHDIERKVSKYLDDKIYFDHGGDPDYPFRNFHMLREINSWLSHGFILVEGRNFFNNMRWRAAGKSNAPFIEANTLSVVGESMKNRMTSKAEDEPLCLATLLGQDPKDILEEKSVQERMKLVVSRIGHVSAYIIFSRCQRIDEEGYRWAPLSFRENSKMYSPGVSFTTVGQVCDKGLLVRLGGIVLENDDTHNVPSEFLVSVGSDLLFARIDGEMMYPGRPVCKGWALVLRDSNGLSVTGSEAVLVELLGEDDGVFLAAFRTHYYVSPAIQDSARKEGIIPGRIMGNQQWCVG